MTTTTTPVGQVVVLNDARRAWIRVPRLPTGELVGHSWRREVVDETGRRIAAASYEALSAQSAHACIWVAPAWRSAGLGTQLWSAMTKGAVRHGIRWLTVAMLPGDAAAARLVTSGGWAVARRVHGDEVRAAVLLDSKLARAVA